MTSVQTTIPFVVRKKCNFYGRKEDAVKEDFSDATARDTPSKYVPTVRKIVTLTSSSESESDSDIENSTQKDARKIVERKTEGASPTVGTPRRRKYSESDGKSYSNRM